MTSFNNNAPLHDRTPLDEADTSVSEPVLLRQENDWSVVRQCLQREFKRVAGVYELALVVKGGGMLTGYVDNPDTAERLLREAHSPERHQGAYIGINPLDAPPPGRTLSAAMAPHAKRADTALVPKRVRLFIDIDANRTGDFNGSDMATADERAHAMVLRSVVEEFLMGLGWSLPAQRGDSGNGAFLVYRINEPNDEASHRLVESVLKGIARATQGIPGAHVDTSVYDAPRIMKIPGTIVAKQESAGRPWRRATEDDLPPSSVVSRDLLKLAALYAQHEPAPETLDNLVDGVRQSLAAKNVRITRDRARNGGRMLDLSTCLIADTPHQNDGSCAINIRPTGVTSSALPRSAGTRQSGEVRHWPC